MEKRREAHIVGVRRLIHPDEVERTKRALASGVGREKFRERLRHNIDMHPRFTSEPARGSRDSDSLLKSLEKLGAPKECYIIASDDSSNYKAHELDDSFQSLQDTLEKAYCEFSHGTILSCVPGKLALFRTAYPFKNLIVHRPD